MNVAENEKKPEYINRERAKEHLIADTAYAAAKMLDEIPAADVAEVKHGEWIKHKPDPEAIKKWHELGIAKGMSENSIFWTCSCCKGWGTPAHKYCSQCGAKMDAKREGAKE